MTSSICQWNSEFSDYVLFVFIPRLTLTLFWLIIDLINYLSSKIAIFLISFYQRPINVIKKQLNSSIFWVLSRRKTFFNNLSSKIAIFLLNFYQRPIDLIKISWIHKFSDYYLVGRAFSFIWIWIGMNFDSFRSPMAFLLLCHVH